MTSQRNKKLSSTWTKHLRNSEDKESLEGTIRNNTVLLTRLRDILEELEESLDAPSENDYETPNWSHLQAHRNGKAEAYRIIKKLTDHLA